MAILRRSDQENLADTCDAIFYIGKMVFDYKNQKIIFNDKIKNLTTKESNVLKELCIQEGSVVSRNMILRKYWNQSDYFTRKSMDVIIYKLRR